MITDDALKQGNGLLILINKIRKWTVVGPNLFSDEIINEDLAGMVGSARQWIITTLDKFQTAGAICYVDCKILILKSDWFRTKSGM